MGQGSGEAQEIVVQSSARMWSPQDLAEDQASASKPTTWRLAGASQGHTGCWPKASVPCHTRPHHGGLSLGSSQHGSLFPPGSYWTQKENLRESNWGEATAFLKPNLRSDTSHRLKSRGEDHILRGRDQWGPWQRPPTTDVLPHVGIASFIHLFMACFQSWTITNTAAVSIGVWAFVWTYAFISLG